MSEARVYYNKQRENFCVKLYWQGERHYFSKYQDIPINQYKDLAENLVKDINSDIKHGVFNPNQYKRGSSLRLSNYYEKWIKRISPSLAYATSFDYKNSFVNHILPVIGEKYLHDINRNDIKYLMSCIKRVPKGKFNVVSALKKLLNDARDEGIIKQVPSFRKLFTGKNEIIDPDIQFISQEDQFKILEQIPFVDRPIFVFICLTGCRPSEARAFRIQDVYIKEGYIKFTKTFGKQGEMKIVKGKKIIPFPISDKLKQLFKQNYILRTQFTKILEGEDIFMFLNPRTGKHYDKSFNRIWNKACKKVGIKISLNNAGRHSFATQHLNANIPEGLVSQLLRHSDPKMIKKYGKYQTSTLKDAVDSVPQVSTDMKQLFDSL